MRKYKKKAALLLGFSTYCGRFIGLFERYTKGKSKKTIVYGGCWYEFA